MDQLNNFLSPPAAPRDFGFFVDGKWQSGHDFFVRHSPDMALRSPARQNAASTT